MVFHGQSEADFQRAITDLCRLRGLLAYHTHDSRRSQPGFPDLVIVGPSGVLFRELKSETGRVRPEQRVWLDRLAAAGADAGVWRPADMDRAVREINHVSNHHPIGDRP